jgi:hypothetical protein
MAIIICPKCGGRGCTKCHNGFIDLQEPMFHRSAFPTTKRIEEFTGKAGSYEELKVLLSEFGSQFVNKYALSIWMQAQNQRR